MSSKAIVRGCDEHHIHSPFMPDLLFEAISDLTPAPAHALLVLGGQNSTFSSVGSELTWRKEREGWERSGRFWEADGNQYELWRTGLVGQEESGRFQWAVDKETSLFLLVSHRTLILLVYLIPGSSLPYLYNDMGYSNK